MSWSVTLLHCNLRHKNNVAMIACRTCGSLGSGQRHTVQTVMPVQSWRLQCCKLIKYKPKMLQKTVWFTIACLNYCEWSCKDAIYKAHKLSMSMSYAAPPLKLHHWHLGMFPPAYLLPPSINPSFLGAAATQLTQPQLIAYSKNPELHIR